MAKQVGPNKLPVVIDKQGRLFELDPDPKNAKPLELNEVSGKKVHISSVQRLTDGKRLFRDDQGQAIEPKLSVPTTPPAGKDSGQPPSPGRAQKFEVNGAAVLLDDAGDVIDVEVGQANASEALIAQNGSLIYYGIAVNDVFAIYRTMLGATVPAGKLFPTTQGELDTITAFATTNGRTLANPSALAIEIKTAWIEADGLTDLSSYITTKATVPVFDKTDPNSWKPNGKKETTLALVGVHVVKHGRASGIGLGHFRTSRQHAQRGGV